MTIAGFLHDTFLLNGFTVGCKIGLSGKATYTANKVAGVRYVVSWRWSVFNGPGWWQISCYQKNTGNRWVQHTIWAPINQFKLPI